MSELRLTIANNSKMGKVLRSMRLLLWLALAVPAAAQNGVPYQPSQGSPQFKEPSSTPATEFDKPDQMQELQRLKALNAARQQSMVSDTNKLLKLVNELNEEIARGNADALSPAQLHKVAQIEKLARNVKEKMSTPILGSEPAGTAPSRIR